MKRIAVLRGGPSEEYDVSLRSGHAVLRALHTLRYPVKDITITKSGLWLEDGFARRPEQALALVDVVFIALHGAYGEDGQVQRVLERLSIPFVGSNSFTSAVAFNKALTKDTLAPHDFHLPQHRQIARFELERIKDNVTSIFAELGSELLVKPVIGGSSINTHYTNSPLALIEILSRLFERYETVLVEEYIRGREATVGIIDHFRGEDQYALPIVEIVPPDQQPIWTKEAKYSGQTTELIPSTFSYEEKTTLTNAALRAHQILNCRHYSRSDFILRDGVPYFLEINTLPGLTNESLFPKAAAAVGLPFNSLVEHLVTVAGH